jgi:regulator of cell morphogenesis and NO signaling
MTTIESSTTLADLVVAQPARARLFEQLQLDYCCGGARTLAEACAQRGLDADTVAALIAATDTEPDRGRDTHDVTRASIGELCDHVVSAHHDKMRNELPLISDLTATVVRVHGVQHPELLDLQRVFTSMRTELETHMRLEEDTLFPACRATEAGAMRGVDDELLAEHESDHVEVGEALEALRELSGGYGAKRALCGTHRALLESLHELELDLHQHVHEENNILFPRVRATALR